MTVDTRFKPFGPCGCGCGREGTLRAKPWRDGTLCVRRCDCRRCAGKRSRAKGDNKARQARRRLRLPGANTRHEELLGGPVRVEFKAGGKAKTIETFYRLCRAQSDAAKAIGDTRPFVAGASPDQSSRTYYVIRDDDLDAFVMGCAQAWGYTE